jgi:DNA polymerase-3 subunit delta
MIRDKVIENSSFDMHRFEGRNCGEKIADAIDSCPLFNTNKFITVKDSELFTPAGSTDAQMIADKIREMDPTTFIIFLETKTDKRTALYKAVNKTGKILECGIQSDEELIKWAVRVFKSKGYRLDPTLARKFIEMSDRKMNSIMNEIEKISAYMGDRKLITEEDIELLTTKSITNNVFKLLDAVSKRDRRSSIMILDEMIRLKEPEQKILFLISTNFIDMFKAVQAKKKYRNNSEIAKATGIMFEWKVRKLLEFSKKFTEKEIRNIIGYCIDADSNIKEGKYYPRLSLEVLISEIVK